MLSIGLQQDCNISINAFKKVHVGVCDVKNYTNYYAMSFARKQKQ